MELYKMALDEYRFEVNLGWDTVRFFTTLNVGILSLGSSFLGLQQIFPKWVVLPIFVIGIALSLLGMATRKQYRKYYLEMINIKAAIEAKLKLEELAISPTKEVDRPKESLENKTSWIKQHMLPLKTVTFYQILVFIIFIIKYGFIILWILYSGHYLFFK